MTVVQTTRRRVIGAGLIGATGLLPAFVRSPVLDRLSDPLWQHRHAMTPRQIETQRFDLLMLGDSITQKLQRDGSPDPRLNVAPTWHRLYGSRNALNLSFARDACPNLLRLISNGKLARQSPRLVTIMIGTNDPTPPWKWIPFHTVQGINDVVTSVCAALLQAVVLLLGLLPLEIRDARNSAINVALARERWPAEVTQFDADITLRRTDGRPERRLYLDPMYQPPLPALHPNGEGWLRLATAIEPPVARLFGDQPR